MQPQAWQKVIYVLTVTKAAVGPAVDLQDASAARADLLDSRNVNCRAGADACLRAADGDEVVDRRVVELAHVDSSDEASLRLPVEIEPVQQHRVSLDCLEGPLHLRRHLGHLGRRAWIDVHILDVDARILRTEPVDVLLVRD